jgi:hypothetical protein
MGLENRALAVPPLRPALCRWRTWDHRPSFLRRHQGRYARRKTTKAITTTLAVAVQLMIAIQGELQDAQAPHRRRGSGSRHTTGPSRAAGEGGRWRGSATRYGVSDDRSGSDSSRKLIQVSAGPLGVSL